MAVFNDYTRESFDGVRRSWNFVGSKVKELSRNRGGSIVDLISKSKVTDVPTLVVSLGGLGGETLNEVKKKFERRVAPQESGKEKVLFVEVDTCQKDMDQLRKNVYEANSIGFMSDSEQIQIINDNTSGAVGLVGLAIKDETIPQHEWIDKNLPVGNDTMLDRSGAHATRQLGRLGLSIESNYEHVLLKIKSKLNTLASDAQVVNGSRQINVILVAGISGGTGSGNIIDFTYLLYLAAKLIGGVTLNIDAILYTPDVQQEVPGVQPENLKRNFVACMKEIDNFFKADETLEEYTFKSGKFPDGIVKTTTGVKVGDGQAIFKGITLVQGFNANGQVLDISIPKDVVSNYIVSNLCNIRFTQGNNYPSLFTAVLSNEGPARTDIDQVLRIKNKLPKDTYYFYRTIGYHEVEFPVEEIMTVVANHVLEALHKEYQKEPSVSGLEVLKETIEVYPFADKCIEFGNVNRETIKKIQEFTQNAKTVRNVREFKMDEIDKRYEPNNYKYDAGWIDGVYTSILKTIKEEFKKNGPYAALRLSQEICASFEVELTEERKANGKRKFEKEKNKFRENVESAKTNIGTADLVGFVRQIGAVFGDNSVQEQIDKFVSNMRNYDVARWKLSYYDACMNAVKSLYEKLVKCHNDVFDKYVGAFLAIQEVLQNDSTGIVQADYSGDIFSAYLLNPGDLKNDTSRLYNLIRYCIKPKDIEELSKKFIESMLENEKKWTSMSDSEFDGVEQFKKEFDTYFEKFKKNIVQRFMLVKYTSKNYASTDISIDEIFGKLDYYIANQNQYPDPWMELERFCSANYNVEPLREAAKAILSEALSIQYCAVEDEGIPQAIVSFANFPKYSLLCLMKDTPDINRIIQGDANNGIAPLPDFANWINNGGQVAEADIPSVTCMKAVYTLPLYMFRGFSDNQKIYYKALCSGTALNAGMHMDVSEERPWKDFPQIVNSDAIRLIEGSHTKAMLREDYKYEMDMLANIKKQADYCSSEENGMIILERDENFYYTLCYVDEAYKKSHWEGWHNNFIQAFEKDIDDAIAKIGNINIDDAENDWNTKFKNNFVKKSLYARLVDAGYVISKRNLDDKVCLLGAYQKDKGAFDDANDAGKGGFYKVIRRSTKSRLLLKDTEQICRNFNKEMKEIKDRKVYDARKTAMENLQKQLAEQKLNDEMDSHLEKVGLFFKGLLYGLLTIDDNKEECRLNFNISKELCNGQSFNDIDYLESSQLEKENILYSVFVHFFVHYKEDDDKYWTDWKNDFSNFKRPAVSIIRENYNKIKEYIPKDNGKYYPKRTRDAESVAEELNNTFRLEERRNSIKFEHFGDTKLTVDDIYINPATPFDFYVGSQLLRFYYEIKNLIRTYKLEVDE